MGGSGGWVGGAMDRKWSQRGFGWKNQEEAQVNLQNYRIRTPNFMPIDLFPSFCFLGRLFLFFFFVFFYPSLAFYALIIKLYPLPK